MKDRGQQAIAALIDFGKILSSKIADAKSSVLAKIEGAGGEQSAEEVLSTHAAIIFRPAEPTSAGACEVMFIRQDDERAIVTSRDVRWQVSVEPGETVVRAFGDSAALLRLKPNGDVVIETSGTIYNGSATATDALALASKVDAELQRIWAVFNTWAVVATDGGGALKVLATAAYPGVLTTPSARAKVDA